MQNGAARGLARLAAVPPALLSISLRRVIVHDLLNNLV